MKRLIVISNRVAVGQNAKSTAGGLAIALHDALSSRGGIWFGWSGKVVPKSAEGLTVSEEGPVTYVTLDLSRRDYKEYYNGFANRTLWPLFHHRPDLTEFTKENYSGYQRVNTLFANQIVPLLADDDTIWVHDYHLLPLGEELRALGTGNPMGFFLHTPFPAMEILIALPPHRALVRAMCSYDVVGFQTERDLRAFLDYVVHEAGGGILGHHLVHCFGRTLRVEVFPIGIDVDDFVGLGEKVEASGQAGKLRAKYGKARLVVGVDRLDYSKGLVHRFKAFERMLEKYDNQREAVTLLQIAPASRSEVPEYKEIRRALEGEAGHINGRFAEFDWLPINYLNRSFNRNDLAGFYRASPVGLVTPLRDGMNLVAKEYVATQDPKDPGVLVLSRFAGAAAELNGALIVNPFDYDEVADAIMGALDMPREERIARYMAMIDVMRSNTLDMWRNRFLDALAAAPYEC